MSKTKKQKQWILPRHRVFCAILRAILVPYARLTYNVKAERFREQGDRPYLILYNHQTPFDQFFIGASFYRGPIYYVATEDIFSNGWISSVIRFLVAPIPIKKQSTDVGAVMNCIRVAKAGGTICIAPEGNRTYSGRTEYMNPAIAPLAKKLKLPIAIYRIEGGYGVAPRWSDKVRRGSMRAYVSQVIEPEEYEALTNEELFTRIEQGLYVNEAVADATFRSNARAEYMERAVYVCPFCGLSTFESHGNEVECKTCGRKISYSEDKRLSGVGFSFPFEFMAQWYDYQADFVNHLDLTQHTETPLFRDEARFSEVIVYKRKNLLREQARISLYGDRMVIDEGTENQLIFPFDEITAISVLGHNKLNVYHDKHIYQFKGSKRFNALKYVNLCYRYKNICRGDINGKFLGL